MSEKSRKRPWWVATLFAAEEIPASGVESAEPEELPGAETPGTDQADIPDAIPGKDDVPAEPDVIASEPDTPADEVDSSLPESSPDRFEPDPELTAKYEKRYQQFRQIYPACRELFDKII